MARQLRQIYRLFSYGVSDRVLFCLRIRNGRRVTVDYRVRLINLTPIHNYVRSIHVNNINQSETTFHPSGACQC